MKTTLVTKEFKEICEEIVNEDKTLEDWIEIESSDMFQTENYCGGFDGIENKFTFSFYAIDRQECWFEFSLEDIAKVLSNTITVIKLSPAK